MKIKYSKNMLIYHNIRISQKDLEDFYANDTFEILNEVEKEKLPYYNRYSNIMEKVQHENRSSFPKFLDEFKSLLFLNKETEKIIRSDFPSIQSSQKSILIFFNKLLDIPQYKVDFFLFLVHRLNLFDHFETEYYLSLRDGIVKKVCINHNCKERREKMSLCLEYIKNLKTNESIIKHFPNSLSLNMKRGSYNKVKSNVAFAKGELTLLPGVSLKKKELLQKNEIFSFRQADFLSKAKPFLQKNYFSQIQKILKLLQNNQKSSISHDLIKDPGFLKVLQSENGYVFFDFEYTSSTIYMIGLYIVSFQTGISYFIPLSHSNDDNDLGLLLEFEKYCKLFENYVWIYYSMEKGKATTWFQSNHKHLNVENWVDLCGLLQNYCAFYGCFNYKLKTIVNFMLEENIIESSYDNDCDSGASSLFLYADYQETKDDSILQTIQRYNEKDCRYMKDILFYILKNFK